MTKFILATVLALFAGQASRAADIQLSDLRSAVTTLAHDTIVFEYFGSVMSTIDRGNMSAKVRMLKAGSRILDMSKAPALTDDLTVTPDMAKALGVKAVATPLANAYTTLGGCGGGHEYQFNIFDQSIFKLEIENKIFGHPYSVYENVRREMAMIYRLSQTMSLNVKPPVVTEKFSDQEYKDFVHSAIFQCSDQIDLKLEINAPHLVAQLLAAMKTTDHEITVFHWFNPNNNAKVIAPTLPATSPFVREYLKNQTEKFWSDSPTSGDMMGNGLYFAFGPIESSTYGHALLWTVLKKSLHYLSGTAAGEFSADAQTELMRLGCNANDIGGIFLHGCEVVAWNIVRLLGIQSIGYHWDGITGFNSTCGNYVDDEALVLYDASAVNYEKSAMLTGKFSRHDSYGYQRSVVANLTLGFGLDKTFESSAFEVAGHVKPMSDQDLVAWKNQSIANCPAPSPVPPSAQ